MKIIGTQNSQVTDIDTIISVRIASQVYNHKLETPFAVIVELDLYTTKIFFLTVSVYNYIGKKNNQNE
jgi:hypothetical protein